VLPLLSQEAYHRDLKHGYARGWEPVEYVRRVRSYRQMLETGKDQRLAATGQGRQ